MGTGCACPAAAGAAGPGAAGAPAMLAGCCGKKRLEKYLFLTEQVGLGGFLFFVLCTLFSDLDNDHMQLTPVGLTLAILLNLAKN